MSQTRVDEFREWINHSRPGQVFIYYTGFLAVDRGTVIVDPTGSLTIEPNGDIDELGQLALEAFDNKRVHLFQRKLHDHEYQYIAFKRRDGGKLW